MSLGDLKSDPVLAGQLKLLDETVTGIRPLTIVSERDALKILLRTFLSDGGERAGTVAALAVIELAKLRTAAMCDSRDDVVDAAAAYVEVCDDPSDVDRRDDERRLYHELAEAVRFHQEGTLVSGMEGDEG